MAHFRWLTRLAFWFMAIAAAASNQDLLCTGGSIHFTAHPVDSLLYQSPDLFHDFYVFKCITTVVFTTGDRGTTGNFSRHLERGLEDAYAYMAGQNKTGWGETNIQVKGKSILFRYLRETPQVKILYLRLPDGAPDGGGHDQTSKESLKKLYLNKIRSITADGGSTYTLDDIKDVVSEILQGVQARDIRILDHKTAIPKENEKDCDHADHTVSARIVVDVVKRDKVEGKLLSYAGSSTRNLDPTMNTTSYEFEVKAEAFARYAAHDEHLVCKNYSACLASLANTNSDNDIKYAAIWMDREYYVQ
ncbi:hypothetical protein P154DRAFT_606112 [Amniculicola lignicola CBS 123094]|uniref:Uncharacterized protein n=1 Tax=Amniculicola lignicola CBS 123094 TaxID=1392246 RepID=A0A6A5X1R7_9PLEO|nr:hypothetical protein P154DRAFT_606112 [Amniculicola lignicola CBS 123094]